MDDFMKRRFIALIVSIPFLGILWVISRETGIRVDFLINYAVVILLAGLIPHIWFLECKQWNPKVWFAVILMLVAGTWLYAQLKIIPVDLSGPGRTSGKSNFWFLVMLGSGLGLLTLFVLQMLQKMGWLKALNEKTKEKSPPLNS